MAANTNPLFVLTPNVSWADLATANTAKDGTGTIGTDIETVFTAGVEGARVEKIVFMPKGANVQTVARVFVNNGSGNEIATNNALIREVTIPASTITETEGLEETKIEFPDGLVLPLGYKINVTIGTAVAGGIKATAFGGDF